MCVCARARPCTYTPTSDRPWNRQKSTWKELVANFFFQFRNLFRSRCVYMCVRAHVQLWIFRRIKLKTTQKWHMMEKKNGRTKLKRWPYTSHVCTRTQTDKHAKTVRNSFVVHTLHTNHTRKHSQRISFTTQLNIYIYTTRREYKYKPRKLIPHISAYKSLAYKNSNSEKMHKKLNETGFALNIYYMCIHILTDSHNSETFNMTTTKSKNQCLKHLSSATFLKMEIDWNELHNNAAIGC